MPLPNLLIAGCQKCGTTWLHHCLNKSSHVFGSTPKELNYFNSKSYLQKQDAYEQVFAQAGKARWRMESTPHYFRLPEGKQDLAKRVYDLLGPETKIIVMLRDPVERYLSSYTHHMMQGRFEYTPLIDQATDQYRMLGLGDYASILHHWQRYFPKLGVFFYDDLERDPVRLTNDVMSFLNTENDIPDAEVSFRTNDKAQKQITLKNGQVWGTLPSLDPDLRMELSSYYRAEIRELSAMTGRSLAHWALPEHALNAPS